MMSHSTAVAALFVLLVGGCQTRSNGTAPKEKDLDPEVARRPGVAEIVKLGGRLKIDDKDANKPIIEVHLPNAKVTDAELALLADWTELRLLDLSGTKISDAGLASLKKLTRLETLTLPFTDINGDGLKFLAPLAQLKALDLNKTQITDASLASLKTHGKLQVLSLRDTEITDDGLRHLTPLSSLQRLDLSGTYVTDEGLPQLQTLTQLDTLLLHFLRKREGHGDVTEAGLKAFRSKHPKVKVSMNQW
jgi:Leucine-rich repeat (LRR) protein